MSIIKKLYCSTEKIFAYNLTPGWNLISLPVLTKDLSKRKVSELLPEVSSLFNF